MHSHTCTNTVGHTVAALSQWALVSGQALSLQLAQTSSDSGRLVDQEPEWTAVSKFTKSCGKKAQLVLKAFHSIMNQSLNIMFYFKKKKKKRKREKETTCMCPKLTLMNLYWSSRSQQPTSAAVRRDSSGGEEIWQVVLSLSFGVHLQPVRQESSGNRMIFDTRTSRCSEDMNKTYSPSDHRSAAFRVSNEIWGVISIQQGKIKKKLCQINAMPHEICMTFR